jgi:hypothetical protein
MVGVNNRYKDSVFTLLFCNEDNLRELYGAIEGVMLDPSIPITINTLSGTLFMELINDVSFIIGNKIIVLIEHQSTLNQNMPLRLLMYAGRIFEKLTRKDDIYKEKRLPLPRPEFIVLYNGTDDCPDEQILKLSDAFEDPSSLGLPKDTAPGLELGVKIYNINKGRNAGMVRRSRVLNGYSDFVDKIREYKEGKTLGDKAAMTAAVNWCIEHDILKRFLEENASEVVNMLFTEWKYEDWVRVRTEEIREDAREEGWEKGREEGIKRIARNALAKGLPLDMISEITGLDTKTITSLASE